MAAIQPSDNIPQNTNQANPKLTLVKNGAQKITTTTAEKFPNTPASQGKKRNYTDPALENRNPNVSSVFQKTIIKTK